MAKLAIWVLVAVLTLLSLAAGGAKLAAMPQEIQFFENVGISTTWMLLLGIVQVSGGLLLIPQKTRRTGSVVTAAGFLASAAMIFVAGNIGFGLMSLLPVALAFLLYLLARK